MPKRIDITIGKMFGKWTVLGYGGRSSTNFALWLCRCSCGTEKTITGVNLRRGRSIQCLSCAHTKHGMSYERVYSIWTGIKYRCTSHKEYNRNYSARGIKICERWTGERGFENFIADVGQPPNHKMQIDRIDNEKDYSPDNVRWATRSVNMQNRRKKPNCSSKYRGVYWFANRWASKIMKEGIIYRLGRFDKEEDAYAAYRKAEQRLYPKP